jgi:hypothetical protein
VDDERIEEMIAELLDALDADPHAFTAWEQTFVESLDEQQHERHLSEKQIDKLVDLWGEKCG